MALSVGVKELLFVDSNARPNEAFAGFPVISALPPIWSTAGCCSQPWATICAARGYGMIRSCRSPP
nr:hypothetical protein [Mesorhizobium huakuii]